MNLWIPIALGSLAILAYAFFYLLSETEAQGSTSFGVANLVGLVAVFIGLIAAGIILRRASPPK